MIDWNIQFFVFIISLLSSFILICFFNTGICDITRRRQWQPTPVLLPGKSHGQRSLVGYTVHGVAEGWTRLSDFTFTFHFHALEKEMATHSSVLAWRIPGTAEPGRLLSMGSHRAEHDWSDLAAAACDITRFWHTNCASNELQNFLTVKNILSKQTYVAESMYAWGDYKTELSKLTFI